MNKQKYKIQKGYFYIASVIFLIIFIYSLIKYSALAKYFPFHGGTDLASYLGYIHFLKEYGFHGLVPNFWGGFILFSGYPIGLAYFVLPLYLLTNNLLLSGYIAFILILILSFVIIYFISKIQKLPFCKILFFYLLLFANPLAIHSIFHIGRLSETFAWLISFVLFLLILFYLNKKIDWKFFIFYTIIYSALILSHIYNLMLMSFFILGLFLVKDFRGKLYIFLASILSLILTSFWWVEFTKTVSGKGTFIWSIAAETLSAGIFSKHILFSYSTLSLLLFFWVFFIYFKYNKIENKKKEFIFYSPILILALLILTKLIIFLPVLKEIPFNLYTNFFIFLSAFLFVKLSGLPKILKKIFVIGILIIPFATILLLTIQYSDFYFNEYSPYKYLDIDEDLIKIMPSISDGFIVLGDNYSNGYHILNDLYMTYAAIYYNKISARGNHPYETTIENYYNFENLTKAFVNKDYNSFINYYNICGVKEIVSYLSGCDLLEEWRFKQKIKIGGACIYSK